MPTMIYSVILMLDGKWLSLQHWMPSYKHRIGTTGLSYAPIHAATPTYLMLQTHSKSAPLIAFAVQVRQGYYGCGHQVQAQTPATALHHMAQTIVLAGYTDPRHF
jgi:hypothetical protein